MGLDCNSLYNLSYIPKINDISLLLLAEYYEMYLIPYTYIISCEINDEPTTIHLKFEESNFCHLLGIESTVVNHVNRRDIDNFKGLKGWNNIKNNQLTISKIKQLNKKGFNNNKTRYVCFFLLPLVLDNPIMVDFDSNKVQPKTNIDCNLLLFNDYHNKKIHLGISYNNSQTYFIPKTFLVETLSSNNDGKKFINGQDKVVIKKIEKKQSK